MAKRRRLSDPRDVGEVLADNHSGSDGRLMGFLQQVSVRTRVYSGAEKFVDELHRRWTTRRGPGEVVPLGAVPQRFLPPEREMPDNAVFISYARDDLPAVQRLKAGLDAAGVKTWFDMERLEGGDDYDRKIQKNIARCAYFVPIVSATTQRRLEGYFRREWSYAIDRTRNMADEAVFILPVCIDDTEGASASVPDKFKSVHFTRLPGGEVTPEFARRLQDLLSSARHERERRRAAGPHEPRRVEGGRAPGGRPAASVAGPRVVHRGDARLFLRPRGRGRRARAARAAQAADDPVRPVGPRQDVDPARGHRAALAARGLLPGLRAHRLLAASRRRPPSRSSRRSSARRRPPASGRRPAWPRAASRCGSSCTTATTCCATRRARR